MQSTEKSIPCPLCHGFEDPTYSLLWPHIRLVHATEPGFHIRCNMDSCSRTFTNMKTYDNHLSRCHFMHGRTIIPEMFMSAGENNEGTNSERDNGEENNEDLSEDSNEDTVNATRRLPDDAETIEELKRTAACWILKIKETCKLTQSAMEEILQGVTDFNKYILAKFYDVIKIALEGLDKNIENIPQVAKAFDTDSPFLRPFRGVEIHNQQLNYSKEKLGFVVS